MIKDLKDIKREEVNLFGSKAVNLTFLMQEGFNIPDGFCISTKINKIDKKIKDEIIKRFKKLNSKVAVRSSAIVEDSKKVSFAGQFDTFLHINSEARLLNAIKKCWKSVKSKRVMAYLKNNGIKNVKMAVIVQRMIAPDFAGVIFTVNPINKKDILIEVIKGLGDKLVSGKITPATLYVDKNNFRIKKKSGLLEIKETLIEKLAKIASKIEKINNYPQDIEFAIKGSKIFILQSRPITTL